MCSFTTSCISFSQSTISIQAENKPYEIVSVISKVGHIKNCIGCGSHLRIDCIDNLPCMVESILLQ